MDFPLENFQNVFHSITYSSIASKSDRKISFLQLSKTSDLLNSRKAATAREALALEEIQKYKKNTRTILFYFDHDVLLR